MKSEMSSPQNTAVSSKSPVTTEISELEHLRKLFVGGLHIFTTEETMTTFYSQFGTVESVIIMRDQQKKSRCFGFVTFTKANMVDEAQKNRPHVIDGKQVESKRSLPRSQLNNPDANVSVRKVFVGGLKDNHDEECLKEHFSQFGNVIGVQIIVDKASGRKRGFGYVEFDDYDAVDKAVFTQPHTLKYVVVDVKKSIYKKQQDQQNFPNNEAVLNQPAPTQNWGPNSYSQPPPNWGGNYSQPPPNWNWGPYWGWNQQSWGPPPNSGWSWNPQSGWVQTPPQQSSQNNSEQKGSSDAQESQSNFNNSQTSYPPGGPPTSYPPGGPPASYPPGGPPPFTAFAGIPPTNYQQPQNSYMSNTGPSVPQSNSGSQQGGWGSGYSQAWNAGPLKSSQNSSNRNNPYSGSKSFKSQDQSSRSNQARQF